MKSWRTGGWATQYWNKPEIKGFDCLQCNLLHLCSCSMERFLQASSSTRNHHVPHEPILHVFYLLFVPIYYFLTCKWQGYMSFAFSHKWGCFSRSIVLKTGSPFCLKPALQVIPSQIYSQQPDNQPYIQKPTHETACNYDDENTAISSKTLKTNFNPLMTFFISVF